jgi:hypothetical protein
MPAQAVAPEKLNKPARVVSIPASKLFGTVLIQGLEFRVYAVSGRLKAELRANSGQYQLFHLFSVRFALIISRVCQHESSVDHRTHLQ